MEKPLLEFKRFGWKTHLMIQKIAKERGIEFMAGPQGQVLHFVNHREDCGKMTFIKDIEQELGITKSVASNLMKRMVKNGLIYLEVSEADKRAKIIRLTSESKERMNKIRDFFDEMDRCLLTGISEEDLVTFFQVMGRFYQNIEKLEKGEANG
ncbi:MarR family transcriptional regulator [Streptococcus intermedius]|uniref:MarR family winged helix-turn-helix transcriptional regulator n=1 Tax=Streptococcus intermedius TaxID=1338 RepID=UPI000C83A746|nr:MarR family winged helix-turn-helix transcriptional regulator [Streptococcus intermedius]PMR93600.1 MarR family transcriptional regulator [Streptococcus intermedius]